MDTGRSVTIEVSNEKWHSSPITSYRGTLEEVRRFLPTFERRLFGPELRPIAEEQNLFGSSHPLTSGYNPQYDVIVRLPLVSTDVPIPVGIVSRNYTLVQHHDVVHKAHNAIMAEGIDPSEVKTQLDLTEYGERMRLALIFPERFNLQVQDKDEMGLRLECFNSVDGRSKFMAVIGWLRFVCSNGLVMGVADSYYRRNHDRYMDKHHIAAVLHEGIAATTRDAATYRKWMKQKVTEQKLAQWTDTTLTKAWGVNAAVRAWHITRSGRDAERADPFEKGPATRKTVLLTNPVSGAILPGDNVFAVSQALSWLAKERRDVQEQLAWKQQIPHLLAPLCGTRG